MGRFTIITTEDALTQVDVSIENKASGNQKDSKAGIIYEKMKKIKYKKNNQVGKNEYGSSSAHKV